MQRITLAEGVSLPVSDLASQGNAILGIRDSGKTYSATWLAEQLIKAQIPIIAFDPIGVWRWLRVGNPGLRVLVAGEGGDFELDPKTAPELVRGVMETGQSLILDLYSMQLNKSDWRHIVADSLRVLLYHNKPHGLRHIFIEEAAEFAPQIVQREYAQVYSEVEKLARMGGNASLGYTIINQRAEQVNKAVLELCDCMLLHRQKGRLSLHALSKWLDVSEGGNTRSKEIIKTMPGLAQGECWAWLAGSEEPRRIKMPKKATFHPDRRAAGKAWAESKPIEMGLEIELLEAQFPGEQETKFTRDEPARSPFKAAEPEVVRVPVFNPGDVIGLQRAAEILTQALAQVAVIQGEIEKQITKVQAGLRQCEGLSDGGSFEAVAKKISTAQLPPASKISSSGSKRILAALIQATKPLTRKQIGLRAGLSASSGTFSTYISGLKTNGFIELQADGTIAITPAGKKEAHGVPALPRGRALVAFWRNELQAGAGRMLDYLLQIYPSWTQRSALAAGVEMAESGTFSTYLSKIRTLDLIETHGTGSAFRLNSELMQQE